MGLGSVRRDTETSSPPSFPVELSLLCKRPSLGGSSGRRGTPFFLRGPTERRTTPVGLTGSLFRSWDSLSLYLTSQWYPLPGSSFRKSWGRRKVVGRRWTPFSSTTSATRWVPSFRPTGTRVLSVRNRCRFPLFY